MRSPILLLITCFLTACETTTPPPPPPWQEIRGRDDTITHPIYRLRVPDGWQRIDPNPTANLNDTMLALCQFVLQEGDAQLVLALHNFPNDNAEQRIPPAAQVARWRRQLGEASPLASTTPFAHGGFVGLAFEGPGVMAWALQLAPEHYRTLSRFGTSRHHRQLRADVTLKATGPEELLSQHRDELQAIARSFELVAEIPSPL